MNKQYVEQTDGVYRLAGTRVSLDSIVDAFWRGQRYWQKLQQTVECSSPMIEKPCRGILLNSSPLQKRRKARW